MKCTAYDSGTLWDYKFVVTFAFYDEKWILCKHKERDTWETSGGLVDKVNVFAEKFVKSWQNIKLNVGNNA